MIIHFHTCIVAPLSDKDLSIRILILQVYPLSNTSETRATAPKELSSYLVLYNRITFFYDLVTWIEF